ncbi:MAG: alpha/beta hydrolase-fold protein [Candidatus Saccharimonadaceae bacterium]
MKSIAIFITVLILCLQSSFGQDTEFSSYQPKSVLQVQDSIKSENYNIQVFLPKDYSTDKKYPVIYFFDANNSLLTNFYISTIGALAYYNNIPKAILVGINQNDRSKELGILKAAESKDFLNFVRTTLKNTIDKKYSTIGYNSYIGHSLGGQLLTYGFINYPQDFYSIINFSPALLYPDNQETFNYEIIKPLDAKLKESKENTYFYCAVGNSGFQDRQFIKGVKEVEKVFMSLDSTTSNYKFEYLDKYTHSISPNGSLSNGLLFLFKDWVFTEDLAMQILIENKVDGLEALNIQLKQIKDKYNKRISLPENVYTNLYGNYFQKKEYEKAIEILQIELQSNSDKTIYSKIAECYKELNNLKEYKRYIKESERK